MLNYKSTPYGSLYFYSLCQNFNLLQESIWTTLKSLALSSKDDNNSSNVCNANLNGFNLSE